MSDIDPTAVLADQMRRTHWWVRLIGLVIVIPVAAALVLGIVVVISSLLQGVLS